MTETGEDIPPTKQFWVLLTVFGGLFTSGVAILLASPLWGSACILAGMLGLGVLVWDRKKAIPVRTPLLVLASLMGSLFIGYSSYQLMAINRDINMYVLPRSVSEQQVEAFRAYLALHEAHSVTVKVNPLDNEAREYWGQIFNALRRTSWHVQQSTFAGEPYTLNEGLCIHEQGTSSKPNDLKHDPAALLRDAFTTAQITVNCGGSSAAGEYKLFILVGHRPLAVGWRPPWLHRLGSWLQSISR